jgi:hypothetical protein
MASGASKAEQSALNLLQYSWKYVTIGMSFNIHYNIEKSSLNLISNIISQDILGHILDHRHLLYDLLTQH